MADRERSAPPALAARFRQAFDTWRRAPVLLHLLAVASLALVPTLRWHTELLDLRTALPDENPYFHAFDRVDAGASPFENTGYLYPPAFAAGGARLARVAGRPLVAAALRTANLLGLAACVWIALAWVPARLRFRFLAGAGYILLAPPTNFGVSLGNLSLAVIGISLAALLLVRRWPVAAGALLGAGIALKPIALFAIPALLVSRRELGPRRPLVAAGAALGIVALLVLPFPHLGDFLELAASSRVERSVTLHRFPALFGFDVHALWISAPIAAGAALLLLRRRLGTARRICVIVTAALACTPLVWSHTLLLALPLQALALAVVVARFRERGMSASGAQSLIPLLELCTVLTCVAGIQFSAGAGNIGDQGIALQAAAAAIPALSPALLAGYLLRTTSDF